MPGQDESWTKHYDEVDFDIAFERDRMLPQPSSSSSAPQLQQQQQPPYVQPSTLAQPPIQQSASHPPIHQKPSFHDHLPSHLPESSSGTGFSRSPRSNSFKSFPSSPLNPASPFGSPQPAMPLTHTGSSSGGQHPHPQPYQPHPQQGQQQHGSSTPTQLASPQLNSPFGRPGSRGSFNFARLPSDFSPAASPYPGLSSSASRGSMILYRRADAAPVSVHSQAHDNGDPQLRPPPPLSSFALNRESVYSTSGDSIISMASDSKYPASLFAGTGGSPFGTAPPAGTGVTIGGHGLVPYAYDPDEDEDSDDGEDDWLHDPDIEYPGDSKSSSAHAPPAPSRPSRLTKGKSPASNPNNPHAGGSSSSSSHAHHPVTKRAPRLHPNTKVYTAPPISLRGLVNISTLVAMVAALLCLFVVYPMVRFYADAPLNARITGNLRINATGQAVDDDVDVDLGDGGTGGTPTGPKISSTVTSINQGGVINERGVVRRGLLEVLGVVERRGVVDRRWERDEDDWVV